MLQLKDLRKLGVGEKVTVWDGDILEDLEGLPGGRAWREGRGKSCRPNQTIIAHWYYVNGYFKLFVCWGIPGLRVRFPFRSRGFP